MGNKSLWRNTKSLLVVLNYSSESQLKAYRKALDQILDKSHVKKLIIIVIVPKEVDKTTLPPHFLIYYHSPSDFTFWGKLKDVLLLQELEKKYDMLLWIGAKESKIYETVQSTFCAKKIGINCSDESFFDMGITTDKDDPSTLLAFVINTINKIEIYE
ncbi:MAG: hypothetical protein FJZ80_00960 [Bacteroidetes bacterium]|nr:hypothetical protein [Bacteroidota bacterium]MBM3424679.1 hypothetical protein [Bacteroidota bacterium]